MKQLFLLVLCIISAENIFAKSPHNKVLRYCYTSWFGRSSSTVLGPEVEIVESFAKASGMKTISKKVKWDDLFKNERGEILKGSSYLPTLLNKDCDLYATNMTFIDWRLKMFDMVNIHAGRIFILTTSKRKDIKSSLSLKGLKTAATPNTTLFESLADLNTQNGGNLFQLSENPSGGSDQLLLKNKIDFIALDASQALQVVKENPKELVIAFPIGKNQSIGWAVSPKEKKLQQRLGEYFKKQRTDSESAVNKIFKKYYGVNLIEYENLLRQTQE